MNSPVDIRQLAVRRDAPPTPGGRTPWLTRYVLPGAILLGFALIALWAMSDSLRSARPVTVVPVLTSRSAIQTAGTPLFQAAGWVEPRPTPTFVTALAEGVVEKLLVVEGQPVEAGQPIATLIDADARLALRTADADVALRQAEVVSAQAAHTAAKVNFEQPITLHASLAEAEALLAQKRTDQAVLPEQLKAAEAREKVARRDFESKEKLAGSVAPIEIDRATAELRAASARVAELQARSSRITDEVAALARRRESLKTRLELRVEETQKLAEARAAMLAADARLKQAEAALDLAKLRLDRMTVRSPAAGRVLALVARPGARLMGLNPAAAHDAATVVTLFDPARLQVRADVRLDDVPRLQPGMRVRIETPAAPGGPLDGHVLAVTSQADIQKNTLQAKVAIDSPPDTIRPDMLVQVTFLAPKTPASSNPASQPLRVLVAKRFVETGEGGPRVWIADRAAGVARLRDVQLGAADGEFVEVVAGLTPADKLIAQGRDGLRDGERILITGEEPEGK